MASCGRTKKKFDDSDDEKCGNDDEKASPQFVAPDSSFKFDPNFKPAKIKLDDAVSKKLTIFLLAGPAGVGKSFYFNMLTRGFNNYSGVSNGGGVSLDTEPCIWQISKTSCVMDTMGMLDSSNDKDEKSRKLMNNILKVVTNVRIIFVTDTTEGRMPAGISMVAWGLLEAINTDGKIEKPHHNLLITKVPQEFMGNELDGTVATMVKCWKDSMDHWATGMTSWPYLIGYDENYKKQAKAEKAVPIIPDFWDWLHHGTNAIKVDPKRIKLLKKMDKGEQMRLRRALNKKIKEAAQDKDAIKKLTANIKKVKKEAADLKKGGAGDFLGKIFGMPGYLVGGVIDKIVG